MALINCPECNQSISDTAKKCPNCGYALKKTDVKKLMLILGVAVAAIVVAALAYYFAVYVPQQIPLQANALLEAGDYIAADKMYARLGNSEENRQLREQLFYESRIVSAAKAVQDTLIFPDSLILSEVVIWEKEVVDDAASTDEQKVYVSTEPEILLHYLAQSKGGSMVDGYVRVNWENGAYTAGRSVEDLEMQNSLPWYIDSKDYAAQQKFWSEQVVKGRILDDLYSLRQIGSFDLERCNKVLKATLGKKTEIIPAGDLVVTPTPRTEKVEPTASK